MCRTLVGLVLLVLACAAGATGARAADAIDLNLAARALDAVRCPVADPAAIARLPENCFVPTSAVSESLADTYFTPIGTTVRLIVPPNVDAARGWDLRLDTMVIHGTLTDVAPDGAVRVSLPVGMDIPVGRRDVRTYDDRIPLPAALQPGDTLVLAFHATRAQLATFELRTASSLHAQDDEDAVSYYGPMALLNGMLLAMALFNLLLYALLRQRSYLLYSLAMLAMIAFETIQSGVAWTMVWPNLAMRDDAPAYVAYVVYFALVTAFARSFLDLRAIAPRTDRILLLALGVLALDAVLYIVFPGLLAASGTWRVVDPIAVTFMIGSLLAAGLVAWKHDVLSARFYVIGFGGAAIGLILGEAADYGIIALPVWHDLLSAMGVAWEAIFLAFALADRIRLAEREAARLSDFAYKDQLTGIPNRRAFDDNLESEWRRGLRTERPVSLLMFDIDFFKKYNDRFGHQQGDYALRAVASAILSAARRAGDFAARYGGEEFAIVLAETTSEGAFASAQAIRRAIRALAIPFDERSLTVSVGCATIVPTEGASSASLIAAADAALYQAKAAGRDRTVVASGDAYTAPAPAAAAEAPGVTT